ncbi:MAG: lytic transglycosylase domain-containing protein, partial [Pseudomonadota bacterium]
YLQIWWEEAEFEREQQKEFYQKYKQYLTRESHKRRFDMLVHDGDRANALGIANVLGGGYVALVEARLALAKKDPSANTLLKNVPAALQNDPGLVYERLRWRRRNDLDTGAMALLAKAPDVRDMHSPKDWWLERHILARRMIEDKKYTQAYQIVTAHRQKEGLPFAQAEWLAGWLALRKKNEPAKAFQHFEKLYKGVKSPISKARGAYWSGMASKALNSHEIAQKWFYVAAQYDTTFYGQMAQAILRRTSNFQSAGLPSGYQQYASRELARAAKVLSRMQKKKEAGFFIAALRRTANSAEDLLNNARLADSMGYNNLSIRAATQALSDHKVLNTKLSHPTRAQDMRNVNGV